jgi:hypothetical protein
MRPHVDLVVLTFDRSLDTFRRNDGEQPVHLAFTQTTATATVPGCGASGRGGDARGTLLGSEPLDDCGRRGRCSCGRRSGAGSCGCGRRGRCSFSRRSFRGCSFRRSGGGRTTSLADECGLRQRARNTLRLPFGDCFVEGFLIDADFFAIRHGSLLQRPADAAILTDPPEVHGHKKNGHER